MGKLVHIKAFTEVELLLCSFLQPIIIRISIKTKLMFGLRKYVQGKGENGSFKINGLTNTKFTSLLEYYLNHC
jgi:hypothetical protein